LRRILHTTQTILITSYIMVILIRFSTSGVASPLGYQQHYALNITGGIFYGPGQMVDSPLPEGTLGYIEFQHPLVGATQFFNNGSESPNIPGEAEISGTADGLLSNGIAFNEHVDGGVAGVGMGAMRFLTVIAADGPNQGREIYELQPDYNWKITTDLALDPGFPEGLVISNNLEITTGIRWVPKSLQTQKDIPGGEDRAGSLPSGVPVIARLGDYDMDGFLDGAIVGASNIPLNHMFLPGAPVVQIRDFVSDIPISTFDASLLVVASINNYRPVWNMITTSASADDLAGEYMHSHLTDYLEDIVSRWKTADGLLQKASKDQIDQATLTNLRKSIKTQLVAATFLLDWSQKRTGSDAIPSEIQEKAKNLFDSAKGLTETMAGLSILKPNRSQ
jgi:hypothetical protein